MSLMSRICVVDWIALMNGLTVWERKEKTLINRENPWDALRTLFAQSVFGSKIDKDFDNKIL